MEIVLYQKAKVFLRHMKNKVNLTHFFFVRSTASFVYSLIHVNSEDFYFYVSVIF